MKEDKQVKGRQNGGGQRKCVDCQFYDFADLTGFQRIPLLNQGKKSLGRLLIGSAEWEIPLPLTRRIRQVTSQDFDLIIG